MRDIFRQQQEAGCTSSNCCESTEWWTQQQNSRSGHRDEMQVEADLAKEMNELSFQEREQLFDEIHGVAESQEETPEYIAKALAEFDQAVSQLFKRKRRTLDRAIFLKPSIQTDDDFKLLFLRAEYFKAALAANRMARYFDLKLSLFGEEKLVKKITQDDVTEEELEYGLKLLGALNQRDRSGRPVHHMNPNNVDFSAPAKSMLRGSWYQLMTLLDEDESASTKGLCRIMYAPGVSFDSEGMSQVARFCIQAGELIKSLPIRYNCYHFCYNNQAIKLLLRTLQQGLGKRIRVRLRTHYGSPVEIRYSLLTYGIDCHIFDLQDENTSGFPVDVLYAACLKRKRQAELRQERQRLDQEAVSGVILYPNPNDVLIGRGHFFFSHSGNRRYHHLIDAQLDTYNQCNNRYQKTAISTEIVKAVRSTNGRFLSPTKGGWEIVDDSVAREKTAIAFRSFKKRSRA